MNRRTPLTLREWMLLLLLVAVGTGVGFYYWLLSPQLERNATARTELTAAQQQLDERRQWQTRDTATIASLQTLAQEQELLQAKFDVISHEQDVIDYFVSLSQGVGFSVRRLEIGQEQLSLSAAASSYEQIRTFLQDIEQSPNIVPHTATIADDQGVYTLQLQAQLTLGQLSPSKETYPRSIPFGR